MRSARSSASPCWRWFPKPREPRVSDAATATLLAGILTFFPSRDGLCRHCHDAHECEVHTSSAASLVIVGDAFHTFVDGAVIAAAVVTSLPLGITTALAVATHEIPQEVGDVAILLRAGYSRLRAFTLNLLAGLGGTSARSRWSSRPWLRPTRSRTSSVRRRQLSLRGDGRPGPRPASRRPRRRAAAPAPADRGRSRHNRHALKSLEPRNPQNLWNLWTPQLLQPGTVPSPCPPKWSKNGRHRRLICGNPAILRLPGGTAFAQHGC